MSETSRAACVLRLFLLFFVPGGGLALLLAFLAAPRIPGYAGMILLGIGFLAFVIATGAATACSLACAGRGGAEPVLRVLDLRRNRGRYAFLFAVTAAATVDLALRLALSLGIDAPEAAGPLAFFGAVALLFVVAWIMIGDRAGTTQTLLRALRGVETTR